MEMEKCHETERIKCRLEVYHWAGKIEAPCTLDGLDRVESVCYRTERERWVMSRIL